MEKPNILLIIADDLGIDVSNGYLESELMPITPNLDALRKGGITFLNAWSTPQCTPTRAGIMSGKFGIKTGVMRPPGNLDLNHTSIFNTIEINLPEVYKKACFGKWHISNPVDYNHPSELGLDHYEGVFTSGVDDYFNWTKVIDGQEHQITEYVTTHLTDRAIDWVSEQKKPWFMWFAHLAPHSPFHIPPTGMYSINDPSNNQEKYIASIEAMDHEMGRLINSFDQETLENTLIIFVGDNGSPRGVIQNFPEDHAKATLYEGGIRVPMIISGKGVERIEEIEVQPTQLTDIYATVLETIGIPLNGGVNNSLSLKPLLSCENQLQRDFIYTDYQDGNILGWAIRNQDYKLIADETGSQEFYKVSEDLNEENNLIGRLSPSEETIFQDMLNEVDILRNSWSCNDGIQNGLETTIDDCENNCPADELSLTNIGCCEIPDQPSVFYSFLEGDKRGIYTNNFPNHAYCFNQNAPPLPTYYKFSIDLEPQKLAEKTLVVRDNGRPKGYFGVATNGVLMAPAPALPFVFENNMTGEYNWDWVFEPINNQGEGRDKVALDCASAHTGPQGYHYHGEMYEWLEDTYPGITTSDDVPKAPIHIGWASDGFPVLYRFGPDKDGNLRELLPSFQLRKGLRPGDGITAPCGAFSGKFTRDYEFVCGKGDLDECNGYDQIISLMTREGYQEFEYFYVVTSRFPQIPRCLFGNVSEDFDNNGNSLEGLDNDNDGFIEIYDCDDNDPMINPLAIEIENNEIDENCDGILTDLIDVLEDGLRIGPNPSYGKVLVEHTSSIQMTIELWTINGRLAAKKSGKNAMTIENLGRGVYILIVQNEDGAKTTRKIIIL